MNRAELVKRVRRRCSDLETKMVGRALVRLQESMVKAIVSDRRVEIRRFGTFFLSHRKGRECRNPRTGVKMFVPGHAVPRFKASRHLLVS